MRRMKDVYDALPAWTHVVVALAALVIVVSLLSGGKALWDGWRQKSGAQDACEGYVEDSLKSPASAEFSESELQERGEYGFTISGAVDSENGFGAMIRNTYVCKVNEVGDGWMLIDLQFAD